MTRSEQLADAFLHVSRVNHYMVGIVEPYTPDELNAAEQILIDLSNGASNEDPELELALDLVEHAKRELVRAASRSIQPPRA